MGIEMTCWENGRCVTRPLNQGKMKPPPRPFFAPRGGYRGLSEREWRLCPVTRTRWYWAEFIALWYTVHGATRFERLRLRVIVWWLSRRGRLRERCTIRLDPEAFGVKAPLRLPMGPGTAPESPPAPQMAPCAPISA